MAVWNFRVVYGLGLGAAGCLVGFGFSLFGLGSRDLDFRGLDFRGLDFRGLGFRGFRGLGV